MITITMCGMSLYGLLTQLGQTPFSVDPPPTDPYSV